jgi:dynein heavy chain
VTSARRHPLLLVGPTGTGKTVTVQAQLLRLDPERYAAPNFIGFSAQVPRGGMHAPAVAGVRSCALHPM